MEIDIKRNEDGLVVVSLVGELSSHAEDSIREQLHPLISERDAKVILDLSSVKTVDSSGLSHLISLVTHARMTNSQVVLSGPTSFVRGVLEVTQLDRWFELADSVEAAHQLLN